MLISKQLNQAINDQVGNEFGAKMQYIAIAGYFQGRNLNVAAKLFFEQAEEEGEHAMKLVHYLLDTEGELRIPPIKAPKPTFESAEEAVQAALGWEKEVTRQIYNLMDIAVADKDYISQSFLRWFVDEQLEEINKMSNLLGIVQQAGEKNLLMLEAYLIHNESGE
jgi:ferritin